jgi:hypothetical protein
VSKDEFRDPERRPVRALLRLVLLDRNSDPEFVIEIRRPAVTETSIFETFLGWSEYWSMALTRTSSKIFTNPGDTKHTEGSK